MKKLKISMIFKDLKNIKFNIIYQVKKKRTA